MRPSKKQKASGKSKASCPLGNSSSGQHSLTSQGSGCQPRRKQELSSDRSSGDAPFAICLEPVLQEIGCHLSCADLVNARLTCSAWRAHIVNAGTADIQLHPNPNHTQHKLDLQRQIYSAQNLRSLVVRTSGRLSQAGFEMFVGHSLHTPKLAQLHIIHLSPPEPRQDVPGGVWASSISLSQLTHLTSLRFTNVQALKPADIASLAALPELACLEINTSVDGSNPACAPNDPSLSPSSTSPTDTLDLVDSLKQLTSLQHLSFSIPSPGPPSECSTLHLTSLTKLTSLELRCSGLGFPPSYVAPALMKLSNLKRLDTALHWIGDPPHLREIGIEDLTQLTSIGFSIRGGLTNLCPSWEEYGISQKLTRLHFTDTSHFGLAENTYRTLVQLTSIKDLLYSTTRVSVPNQEEEGLPKKLCELKVPHLTSLRMLGATTLSNLEEMTNSFQELTTCHLTGIMSERCPAQSLRSLRQLRSLKSLTLHAAERTREMLEVDPTCLSATLEDLSAKFVHFTNPTQTSRLTALNSLSLMHCSSTSLAVLMGSWTSLTGLLSLELDDLPQLQLSHLSHVTPLTQLTSLSLMALGSTTVNNSALDRITSLTRLKHLKWHAGDMLDSILDPTLLKSFQNLHRLCITTSMFWRMTRWGALNVVEFLPYCHVEATGG